MHAAGGRHFRGTHRAAGPEVSDSWSLPGASGDRGGVRRENRPGPESVSRQDERNPARRQDCFPEVAEPVYGDALPFAHRRAQVAAPRAGNFRRNQGRDHHGTAAPQISRRRRAVSSGIGAHRRGKAASEELPGVINAAAFRPTGPPETTNRRRGSKGGTSSRLGSNAPHPPVFRKECATY